MNANAELGFEGYVDLSYTIDDLGNAANVQVIESSSENSSRIERLIEVQLRSMKFRPVLTAGELSSPGPVEARYYYAY
jgi:outer membrane biosynthesis protein TonB